MLQQQHYLISRPLSAMRIASGRLHREEDAVREALALWEQRERARAEILAAADVAEASVARGIGRSITKESTKRMPSRWLTLTAIDKPHR